MNERLLLMKCTANRRGIGSKPNLPNNSPQILDSRAATCAFKKAAQLIEDMQCLGIHQKVDSNQWLRSLLKSLRYAFAFSAMSHTSCRQFRVWGCSN